MCGIRVYIYDCTIYTLTIKKNEIYLIKWHWNVKYYTLVVNSGMTTYYTYCQFILMNDSSTPIHQSYAIFIIFFTEKTNHAIIVWQCPVRMFSQCFQSISVHWRCLETHVCTFIWCDLYLHAGPFVQPLYPEHFCRYLVIRNRCYKRQKVRNFNQKNVEQIKR